MFTQWYNLPNGALWLYAETLASTATDIDLFVGRDEGDGFPDEWEELCTSTTPQELERCDLYDLEPGDYWIVVQNWTGSNGADGDAMTLRHAAIEPSADSKLSASGPGITGVNESFPVRVSWDNFEAAPGETWLGAVGVGSSKSSPSNVGVIPVMLTRNGVAAAETLALMDGRAHGLALAANGKHDRVFIDVPPGAQTLTVSATGADNTQSSMLKLELVRLDFEDGLSNPPLASPAGNAPVVDSAQGSASGGPTVTRSGGVEAGRWYAVLSNASSSPVSVEIQADVEFQGAAIDVQPGLWFPPTRSGQGYDYNWGGADRALIWYTYDEAGLPAWYIASAPANDGNIWVADILRVTNDGESQQLAPVGSLSVTALAPQEALFSYTLYGKSGTERTQPLSGLSCPQVNGSAASYTGIWFRGEEGLGGASVLVNSITQSQIHYLFDEDGMPRWLFAQDPVNDDPLDPEIPILQFSGYCAVCAPADVGFVEVGTLDRSFGSETSGSWTWTTILRHRSAAPSSAATRSSS